MVSNAGTERTAYHAMPFGVVGLLEITPDFVGNGHVAQFL